MEPPRCLGCYYILTGLPGDVCPECGRSFDLSDPDSYTTRLPFARWTFWAPGLLVSVGGGVVIYLVLMKLSGVGFALTLVLPFSLGSLIGYTCRVGRGSLFLTLALAMGGGLLTLLLLVGGAQAAGIYCAVILAAIFVGPILLGALVGSALRSILKQSRFSQRDYLPVLLLLLAPLAVGMIERRFAVERPIVTVVTSATVRAPIESTWRSLMFYEDVTHHPPLLLWLGLPRPLYTRGQSEAVGDIKICVYHDGRLAKRVTDIQPQRLLSFDVIEQVNIENCTTRLLDGSFALEPISSHETRIILTTRYEALIRPRWCWEPFERLTAHTLHEHVLKGIRLKAESAGGGTSLAEAPR